MRVALSKSMMSPPQALRRLNRSLGWVLALRSVCRLTLYALLAYGTGVLLLRLIVRAPSALLVYGLVGVLLVSAAAAIHGWRRRPSVACLRASLDAHNRAGGLIMVAAELDTAAWATAMPPLSLPRPRWSARPPVLRLAAAAAYVILALAIPSSQFAWATRPRLEVGPLVQELEAQLEALAEEQLIERQEAADLQETLDRLERESSGEDPARTWEALDHLKRTATEKARDSAEEMLARMEELSQAETLAAALAQVASTNLSESAATEAYRVLEGLLLGGSEDALAEGEFPPDLLSNLNASALDAGELAGLLGSIGAYKGRLGAGLTNLAKLKLIDAELLGKCSGACRGGNTNALAAFLAHCESTNAIDSLISLCRGGVDRGRGDAPMTWTEATSEENAQFKEEVLPPGAFDFQQAQLLAVSAAAPQPADPAEAVESGALADAERGGGSAVTHRILPRHRPAVERFFRREP